MSGAADEKDQGIIDVMNSIEDTEATIRLFVRSGNNTGGYFVLGRWAPIVAQQFVKSTTVLTQWGVFSKSKAPLQCVHVNENIGREVIREALLHLGASVEVFDRPSGGGPYTCKKRGSPGNASSFEDILFGVGDAEVQLMSFGAIHISAEGTTTGRYAIGCVIANTTLRTISHAQFVDSEQLVNLDALITQCHVKEIYISQANGSDIQKSLRRILSAANVTVIEVQAKEFNNGVADVTRKLQTILRVQESTLELTNVPNVLPAMNCLLNYSKMTLDDSNLRAFSLKRVHPDMHLRIDTAAVNALNLVAPGAEAGKGKLAISIYGWLNQCASGMGSRLLRQWLLQPLQDVSQINYRLDVIEVMSETAEVRDNCRDLLRHSLDLDRLNRKLQRGSCSLREIYSLLTLVNMIPSVNRTLEGCSHSRYYPHIRGTYVNPLTELHEEMENLTILIEASVDPMPNNVRMKPEFDDELMELDELRVSLVNDIDKEFKNILKNHSWTEKTLKMEEHATYGHVFRVSRKDDKEVRTKTAKFQTVSTAKDGVRFTTEKLSALNSQYRKNLQAYDKRQLSLRKQLVETVATYLPILDTVKEKFAELDVFCTIAHIASQSRHPMTRPTILEAKEGVVNFVNLRHPLVELRQPEYVPNSISMGGDRNANGLIITGPNMGGKSTLMRSVGIGVILAQAGFFVPAEDAQVSIRDGVLCRVGATDHMSQGVSTFMVEMLESAAILATATSSSMVIIDELGRGTSTFDGFGLAWSIAHEIACVTKASLLFSTHFHEMTELADEFPTSIKNVHVGAETSGDSHLRFTYKLEPGACGRSFGILVAELANMPKVIVDEAKRKAAEMEDFGANNNQQQDDGALVKKQLHMLNALPADVSQRLQTYAQRIHQLASSTDADAADKLQQLRQEISADDSLKGILAA